MFSRASSSKSFGLSNGSAVMVKKPEVYEEAEAQRRFEQALKGAAKAPAKKAKPPAPKRKRPTDHKGGKSGGN